MIWLLILLLAGLAAGMAYYLSRQPARTEAPAQAIPAPRPPAAKPVKSPPSDRKCWGKQLVVPEPAQACASARVLNGQRFAFGRVPPLPLKGCEHDQCACHFEDLLDMRVGVERRAGHERREQVRFEDRKDRRIGKDRRQGEHYDWRFTA